MSEMPTYLSIILNEGKYAIGHSLIQRKRLRPHSFVAGDQYNFTPTEDGLAVKGNVVYTGGGGLISGRILTKDSFRFSLIFPEKSGPFTIGNIILYMQSEDGTVFPFIWVALKIPYPKETQQDNSIGNRFVFELIEKLINANDALNITVQPSDFASLASFSNELELPNPSQSLFQQFTVHEPKYAPVPFMGARRASDNSFWGFPLFSKLGDPFFGVLDGGRAGESKKASNIRFYWGGRLTIPPTDYKRRYGGGNLSVAPQYSIGGLPLPTNPGYVI